MHTCFNREGIQRYPEELKRLRFCNWRFEQTEDGPTKVPYQPGTDRRAMVNDDSTTGTLEEALASVENYDGICAKVAGGAGFIDLDGCILQDGSLTETAQRVLKMLPDAMAEVSPSGDGLHLAYLTPEGFVPDTDIYYINNRAIHVESYYPGCTNRFITMTGNIYREGSLRVTAEQLRLFHDTFMRRPENNLTPVQVPEGGSVLTDEEVIRAASSSATGQKFMDLYQGNWTEYGDGKWSQSEADLAFCAMLAFYCRGDKEQMDRIFRESGLMREKWDRHQSGTTYGEITMNHAINGCAAFYEPGYRADSGEDFSDLAEPEADNQMADAIDALLAKDSLSIDEVFSEEFLSVAAWAKQNDIARYTKLRQALPRGISIRDFEREMKKHLRSDRDGDGKLKFLRLSGVSTTGMLVPENWQVTDHGIRHLEMVLGEMSYVRVTSEPMFVSSKLVNVDDGTEKLEVTFRRNGKYKKLIAPRADLMNKNAIIKYADEGLPVSSGTAGMLTKYVDEVEALNSRAIPIRRSIRRAGWIGDEFYPYSLKGGIVAQTDGNETERILAALKKEGSEDVWMDSAAKVRRLPFARAMLAASFASPLLEKLKHRVIYLHIWYSTKSGKTASLKFAMSVWGDPQVLVSKYFSTIVGMERWSGTLKHLPFALDELQTLNQKKLSVNDIVYTLGNGSGKTRGRVGNGLQKVETWRNCILSTGEMPMSNDNSMDGVNTRLMELYACPLSTDGKRDPDDALASDLHKVSESNYGFAGEKYIRFLVSEVLSHEGKITEDYDRLHEKLEEQYPGSAQLDNAAVLALGDYYSSLSVFDASEQTAFDEAVSLGMSILADIEENRRQDSISMAWDLVSGWVASNRQRFIGTNSIYEATPIYGMVQDDKVYAICTEMNKALEDGGFSVRKCVKGFQERGLIESFTDSTGKIRFQTGKRIKGVLTRVYALKIKITTVSDGNDDKTGAFEEPKPLEGKDDDFLK